jgi:hypothetical protein
VTVDDIERDALTVFRYLGQYLAKHGGAPSEQGWSRADVLRDEDGEVIAFLGWNLQPSRGVSPDAVLKRMLSIEEDEA